ncbi:MAG: T9SS type A sorting domain-containing protein [Bacteroidetes bacterium]|nr:T9SS type A sorting domain-containing protein [Bacteroidota bacterium]
MKKCLFIALSLCVGGSAYAQKKLPVIPQKLQNLSITRTAQQRMAVDMSLTPNAKVNPSVTSRSGNVSDKSVNSLGEAIIGVGKFDLQTNMAIQNRIYAYPDGTVGAAFIYGQTSSAFSDRGTGYNYFDGTSWGENPTGRIETSRTGWPSYCPLNSGELIVSHNGTNGLVVSKRADKGTGAWEQSIILGPSNSGHTTTILWPRTVTSGNTIHILACTDQAETGSTPITYQGLQLALVYIRSVDGGTTWDAPRILPGMDSASVVSINHKGFGGDSYSWANAIGDTVAFVVGDDWGGLFVMKSTDGGDNWNKIPIYTFPTFTTGPTGRIPSIDGDVAIALDNSGAANVCVGRMFVSDNTDLADDSSSWYPYTDGLIYWKEGMPVLDTASLSSVDSLINHGNLIGYMRDWNESDSLEFPTVANGDFPFGLYYISLSSMPQIIANENSLYVTYSSCMESKESTGATPNTQLYRHVIFTKSADGGTTWDLGTDLNSSPIHDFEECVFASLSPTMPDGNLHLIYQGDEEPGLAERGDEDAYGTNNFYYLSFPTNVGINEITQSISNVNVYPNPATDFTYVNLTLSQAQDVSIFVSNMLGQKIYSNVYGKLSAGNHTLSVEAGKFSPGIYFYTIKTDNSSISRKMIVE